MFTRKRFLGALTVVAVLAAAGAAIAYFTSTGTGTGSASVGTASNWGVTSNTAGGPMYPGANSTDQTATIKVTNNGTGSQQLNSFTISVANSDGSPWASSTTNFPSEGACSANDFALGGQAGTGSYTVSGIADDLAPGQSYTKTVNLHMLDTGVAQDNCQGLTGGVPLYVTAN